MENNSSQQHMDWGKQREEGGERAILAGNAYQDGIHHRGWFIGHFFDPPVSIRSSQAVEVKWCLVKAGEEKAQWTMSEQATTLCLLIRGKLCHKFPFEEHILSHEGDYVLWSPGVSHTWIAEEDSLVLAIRWPSVPGAIKQQQR
ncbi:MAG: hypothetical protein PVS3B3_33360 [Ktedonobacteraceae bacterium]